MTKKTRSGLPRKLNKYKKGGGDLWVGFKRILAQTAFKELLFIYLFILHTIFKAVISLLPTLLPKRTKCYQ